MNLRMFTGHEASLAVAGLTVFVAIIAWVLP